MNIFIGTYQTNKPIGLLVLIVVYSCTNMFTIIWFIFAGVEKGLGGADKGIQAVTDGCWFRPDGQEETQSWTNSWQDRAGYRSIGKASIHICL